MSENFDIKKAAENINRKNREIKESETKRKHEAQKEGKIIAQKLKAAMPEIKGIWGFGSSFENNRLYNLESDIDLAIEGGDILKAYLIAEESEFKVDIIAITNDDTQFSKLIKENGIRLV